MTAKSGTQYLEGLRDAREIWYDGEQVNDVATHPAFASGAQVISELYDLQHDSAHQATLTSPSPKTGEPVGRSFLMPRSVEALIQRRAMMEVWAEVSHGMLSQSPDYMNIGIMSLAAAHDFFAQGDPRFGIHILRYYEACREQDRCLAQAFSTLWPHSASEAAEALPHVHVVAQRPQGLIVQGACTVATLAPFADELVICGGPPLQRGEGARALVCAIPVATPGLSLLCREPFGYAGSRFDHPLAARFKEMDCVALFNDVLVPWERVFLHANIDLYNHLTSHTRFLGQVGHQVITRQIAKTTLILGVAHLLSNAIGSSKSLHVQEKLGEIVTYLETLRSCLRRAETDAVLSGGVFYPQPDAVHAALRLFPTFYSRMLEILQILGADRYLTTPRERDLQSPVANVLTTYYQGAAASATDCIQLFRLAWDLVGESFGAQQQLYERYSTGDPVHMMATRYLDYDKHAAATRVESLLQTQKDMQVKGGAP